MPDPEKTQKVREFPVPSDVTKIHQFLGLASYYRHILSGFSCIAAPLHDLTKMNIPFTWTAEYQAAFDHLKTLLGSAPVLVYPRFVLETDAVFSHITRPSQSLKR